MRHSLLASCAFVMTIGFATARDDDPIKAKLEKAKAAYATEVEKFRKDVGTSFDKREAAARAVGDKKLLDQIKAERQAFEEREQAPAATPKAVRQRLATARAAVEKAYETAIKEYTMARNDDAASLVEKELTAFKMDLDPSDTRRRWVHDKGVFTHKDGAAWEEKGADGNTYQWKETGRTKGYVELHAVIFGVAYTVRLSDTTADYQSGKTAEFKKKFSGKWAD